MIPIPDSATRLSDLVVIAASGADAVTFLQGQLTNDVAGLPPDRALLAGYCTPKGRLLGNMVLWRSASDPDLLFGLTKADIAPALIKRLSMFVLRAKARLTITPLQAWGATLDDAARTRLSEAGITLPASSQPYSVVHTGHDTWIAAPRSNSSSERWWFIAGAEKWVPPETTPVQSDPGTDSATPASQAAPVDEGLRRWQLADIAAGLPWVVQTTQDTFIPQTLNMDLIGGVSFTKGCYPGQEVVARSHYRGTVKRRMAYGVARAPGADAPIATPGTDIYDANNPKNPCGRVINAAFDGQHLHLLLEVQLSDLEAADFRLGAAEGPTIEQQDLPYSIAAT